MLKVQGIETILSVVQWGGEEEIFKGSPKFNSLLQAISEYFGIERSQVQINYYQLENGEMYIANDFFVKKFNFDSDKFYIWKDEWKPSAFPIDPVTILNTGNTLEFAPLNGAEAQNNINPKSTFNNHAIIKYSGKYYDPSYGSEGAMTKENWISSSLAGVGNGGNLYFYQTDKTERYAG